MFQSGSTHFFFFISPTVYACFSLCFINRFPTNGQKQCWKHPAIFYFLKRIILLLNVLCGISQDSYSLPQAKLWKWIMSFSNLLWLFLPPALNMNPCWDCKTLLRQRKNVKLICLERHKSRKFKGIPSNYSFESMQTESTILIWNLTATVLPMSSHHGWQFV